MGRLLWIFGINEFYKRRLCLAIWYAFVILFTELGSIDPSKEPTDILNLNGVDPEDPTTYNDSFYILKENNICV